MLEDIVALDAADGGDVGGASTMPPRAAPAEIFSMNPVTRQTTKLPSLAAPIMRGASSPPSIAAEPGGALEDRPERAGLEATVAAGGQRAGRPASVGRARVVTRAEIALLVGSDM
ncbi:hypothetical protein [Nannocystis sp. SCPEA4]|uniref:hypothetical protein n=1 Tax=Nannocystis sp. SCPEA4 TaxID=2996787 RepID=UPI00226EC4C3|nr:hypothetical protein [Nannocystis sp. SCPEA4]MCY1055324.1 hypothetical protein [Nannocystis sp. SCPEA4]